jgi:uncharacterized membrane protein YphA (DoxX/SURF4 family)
MILLLRTVSIPPTFSTASVNRVSQPRCPCLASLRFRTIRQLASRHIVVECVGGLLVLTGYRTRVVGLVLAVWCIATALIAHTNFADPNQMVHFLKNLAMAGGFLQLAAFGGDAWSIDFRSVRALQGAM